MEINGTEVGLGIGALVTTVLAFLGFKPKKEDPMQVLRREINKIHGRQDRFEDSLKFITESTRKDMDEIKEDLKLMSSSLNNMSLSLARLNAFHEVAGHEKKAKRD